MIVIVSVSPASTFTEVKLKSTWAGASINGTGGTDAKIPSYISYNHKLQDL